jgi:4-hydroxybenzoate polyprenyltransferase
MGKIRAFLELTRPANVITALSDVIAGMSIVGFIFGFKTYQISPAILLGLSTMCLYAGGVVMNDVFDRHLDKIERPERALPSGRLSLSSAIGGGIILFALGIIFAFFQSVFSGILASILVLFILLYDSYAKNYLIFGPIIMGVCRSLNLGLGMSVYEFEFVNHADLTILPLLYIAAITLISKGEVNGSKKWPMLVAFMLYLVIQIGQIHYSFLQGRLIFTFPFVLIHAYFIYPPLLKAYKQPIGSNIGKAVKSGVLSLIIMNAGWTSIGEQWFIAIFVFSLLGLSRYLAKQFAVT